MDEELQHVNPCPPDWLTAEQKEKLKGDCIEGTAYNQRWVLNSLMAVWNTLHDLLPSLQKETNLVRYDITPLQSCQPASAQDTSAPDTPLLTPQHAAVDATPNHAPLEDEQPSEGTPPPQQEVVELPEDIERCVCELWDMCANKHVARHVLEQGDQLVLHMLSFALRDPTAPRLTETLTGLVFNICHEDEGCRAVLENEILVHMLVSLPERCNDSSVLVQVFSLLHRLVYYLNRLQRANSELAPGSSSTAVHFTSDKDVEMVETANLEMTSDGQSVCTNFPTGTNGAVEEPINTCSKSDKASGLQGPCSNNGTAPDRASNDLIGADCTKQNTANDVAKSEEYSKLMSSVLHSCNIQHFLAFILHHSLHEELVATTVRLLEELLFFKDPEAGVYLADLYAETGLVPGLLRLVSKWHRQQKALARQQQQLEDDDDDEFDSGRSGSASRLEDDHKKVSPVVHNAFICLYAFVDTKAADFIVSSKSGQASLEPALVLYISELVASIEVQLRLLKNQPPSSEPNDDCGASLSLRLVSEKLGCALRLLGLLKRSLTLPEVILGLAKLLALLDLSGIFCDDPVEKNSENMQVDINEQPIQQEAEVFDSDNSNGFASNSCSSNEPMEPSPSKPSNPNKAVKFLEDLDMLAVGKKSFEADEKKQRERQLRKQQNQEYQRQMRLKSGTRTRRRSSLHIDDITHIQDSEEVSVSEGTLLELRDLRRAIEVFFASTLHYWFTFGDLKDKRGVLCSILVVLEQCHMHEVLLVLDALKKFEAGLVAKIQETLLDHQAYPRMVALLAELYQ